MNILITGGAGYIGSMMTKRLLDDGHQVTVVDSLERGHAGALDNRAQFFRGDLLDSSFVASLFSKSQFDGVMNFAGYIAVGESMKDPGLYFKENIFTTMNMLDAMRAHDVTNFIFSSTGTVYGNPKTLPTPENHVKNPENPYAESKLMVETILRWYHTIYDLSYTVLRYFNASGAALDGSIGEDHTPETHLIPNAIKAALEHKEFALFGDDYDTRDGSCIRDYIHVLDLVEAHVLAMKKLLQDGGAYTFNVGTGKGYTNKEVVAMVKKISNVDFPIVVKPRREGDAQETVADASQIQKELGFSPKHSDLETIITSAYLWHSSHPSGYNE